MLVVSHVPSRSKSYPVGRLAAQVMDLRAAWIAHTKSDDRLPEGYRVSARIAPEGVAQRGVSVRIRGWRPHFHRLDLIDAMERFGHLETGAAQRLVNRIVDGWAVTLTFEDGVDAEEFVRRAAAIGVVGRI